MNKILIVEDDRNIAYLIANVLMLSDYQYVNAYDGFEALECIDRDRFDLIILDIMLPGLNGFDIQDKVKHLDIPIIFLTALQDVHDKVNGLRAGAEDYIVKPFEPLELLARIAVVLRRTNREDSLLKYGDISVNINKHIVIQKDKVVNLTPTEFDIFVFFLRNVDIAIFRECLFKAIWNTEFVVESRTIDTHIQNLRRKLNLQNKLITIPRIGYRLEKE